MGQKIRLGVLLVLGLLVLGVLAWSVQLLRRESPRTAQGFRLEFRYDGPNPSHYSTIALDGDGVGQDPAGAVQRMLSQIPGEPNLVAILSSNDGTVRQEWRWLNRSWKRADEPVK
jgi:hypothetical protein